MRKHLSGALALTALLAGGGFLLARQARGSDHADTKEVVNRPGSDLTDVYMFESKADSSKYVLAMNVNPLIPSGQGLRVSFDPDVLYQFKIDQNGDGVEDRVIQVWFEGTGNTQVVHVSKPMPPNETGSINTKVTSLATTGVINHVFTPQAGMKVFAGPREDPFFFDLEQFFNILPDRGVPPGLTTPPADPNAPQQTSWRAPGVAKDFLSNGGYNVLSIVIELPKADLLK
ncbi:MAG: DUF4331 family protein [Armatimonadota bacterium]